MIELKNISFSYANSRENSGIRRIDLAVKKGELVILAGKSGCGKTTLTRVLNGLCPQFYPGNLTGNYLLDGQDALKMPIHQLGTMVGSVFQDPRSQFFTTNTTDEIALGMENIPLERAVMQERVKAVCAQMNIDRLLDRRIFPLSSGEKQLVAIASICAMEPKVIVMDEPSANLDSDAMTRLGTLLYRLKEAGHTIILSEHRFHYVRDSFDRLVFMENGEISAIYGHGEALELSAKQLAAMGLRPFDTPAFQVGGAFQSKPEDTLQVSEISCGKYSIPQKMNHPLTETRSGDLYFCLEQRLVTIREQPIELTVKEFEIFSLLILNPKRVFTYEMLMELVWEEDYTYYSRKAVNNHVSNLRRKLKIAPNLPDYVKSVYGIGYKFEAK